jgi:hypothetical protein
MATYRVDEASLTTVADAIRARSGVTGELEFPNGMKEAVEGIPDLVASLIMGQLKEYSSDEVTTMTSWCMASFTGLVTLSLPNCKKVEYYSFNGCTNLENVDMPQCISLNAGAFNNCRKLPLLKLPSVTYINVSAFNGCSVFEALILPNTAGMCTLANTNAFAGTPIASGTGYIYVPRAYLSDTDASKDYRRATNWSTFAAQFRALEDYTVDGTTTGALDPNKI